ncbi:hypothetical protein ACFW88_06390, partial [Streptomyces anandii]
EQPTPQDTVLADPCSSIRRGSGTLSLQRCDDHANPPLRHFYASVLLDAGESIKALSVYLGHADAGFTLRTYTHLMPSSETRTRKAVDAMYRAARKPPAAP